MCIRDRLLLVCDGPDLAPTVRRARELGISEDVEADDSIFDLTKARLPWLILGLFGGLGSVFILESFESIMGSKELRALFFYTPLNFYNDVK